MKYALLIAEPAAGSAPEFDPRRYAAVVQKLREEGSFRGARRFAPASQAATVRARGEGTLVSDGPASSAAVTAFVIAELPDLASADAVASELAEATGVAVEARPVAAPGEGGPDAGKEGVQPTSTGGATEYAFLMCLDEAKRPWPGDPAFDELMERCGRVLDRLETKSAFRGTERLQLSSTARTARPGAAKARVVDGPFTEARELIGGFILGECATREEALALAGFLPGAVSGAVEVRAVVGE